MNQGFTIPVLDHGYVRYIEHMGSDSLILEAARVSYKSPSKGEAEDKKLLNYLYANKHTSPFEMGKVVFNIKLPIFVMRQFVRHRMQNLNEVSARYTQLPNEFYIPTEWRKQDAKNKQSSVAVEDFNPLWFEESGSPIDTHEIVETQCKYVYFLYEQMLEKGIAREMARMILPVNIYTEIYCCWDMKNLIHFITLREDAHAQAEIQEYAKAMKAIVSNLFPWTIEAYETHKAKV